VSDEKKKVFACNHLTSLESFDQQFYAFLKGVAAANALRRIFPGVQARGVVLTVPMYAQS
jgi:hypothetical protein